MKFSIITPVYNGEKYIAETIESVLSQEGDFEIEYIIADGGSTDNTVEIIKSYDDKLSSGSIPVKCRGITFKWFSEKDAGMYDAINKGFLRATGDIYAYINSDDLYLPGAMDAVSKTFYKYKHIAWLKGINSLIDESSKLVKTNPCYIYNRKWIEAGIYGKYSYFIHQESVFWKKELWIKSGGIEEKFKLAGDYYLWAKFSEYSNLWSLNLPLSCFRRRAGQLSEDSSSYQNEQLIVPVKKIGYVWIIRTFFYLESKSPACSKFLFRFLYIILFPGRNKQYVDFDKNEEPILKTAVSFTV